MAIWRLQLRNGWARGRKWLRIIELELRVLRLVLAWNLRAARGVKRIRYGGFRRLVWRTVWQRERDGALYE